jgi:acetolactate synthase-1/2/3 large subunit
MIEKSGAEILVTALKDLGFDTIFGYPGGAMLPIYDALFLQNDIRHILVRHEAGAAHAAEGYARSSGKPGVVMVTSGPGATNVVTGLADAPMDSIPIVVLTGQVPTHLIGTDAFQECDTVGVTRHCTKHNYLVKDPNRLGDVVHEAFHIATTGRPGPVLIDIPKDVQVAGGIYFRPERPELLRPSYNPPSDGDPLLIETAVEMIAAARRPVLYTGGGVIASGPDASRLLRDLATLTGAPVTSTLMGLGAFPASSPQWLGMLGMHGTYEANLAMNEADLIIALGARFDDRVTGKLDGFSPNSRKIHVDIDRSSIGKIVPVDLGIAGDVGKVLDALVPRLRSRSVERANLAEWTARINGWRARDCLAYSPNESEILPQHAIVRLREATQAFAPIISTEVGQHQMWAAQHLHFESPNKWLTSGGLGTWDMACPRQSGHSWPIRTRWSSMSQARPRYS